MSNIQIIDRVHLILRSFTTDQFELGVTELSRITGLSKSTVHRLANAMVHAQLLSYNQDLQKFRLGISLLHLGNIVKTNLSLLKTARPNMVNLRDQTDESVMLKVVDGDYAVAMEYIETNAYLRPKSRLGQRDRLYAGASSKVLLAFMTDDEIERVLDKGVVKLTQNTPDRQQLMEQLSAIRKNGYAVSFGERVEDGVGISVPVYDATQTVVASLTVIGPCHRLTEQRINELVPQVINTGKKISLELGFNDNLGVVLGKKNLNEIVAGEQL